MRIAYLSLLLAIGTSVFGQNGTYVDAKPRLELLCPDAMVAAGDEFSVKARFGPVTRGTPVYNWTVSSGFIVRGQGTPEIAVRADLEGVPITAWLEIGGGPFWFEPLADSCTTAVAMTPKATLLADLGVKNIGYVEVKFDELFAELWNDPTSTGVITISARRRNERVRLKRWASNLVNRRDFDASRLKFVENKKASVAGFRLWLVPAGADLPIESTSIDKH